MVNIYNAPKPKFSTWEWFKLIVVRMVFPPIIVWDLISYAMNLWLGEWIGLKVLPAQLLALNPQVPVINDENIGFLGDTEIDCKKHLVKTHDGASLDTFEAAILSQSNLPESEKTYIINFEGNGGFYETSIGQIKSDAKALNTNVIAFNYRGVAKSCGHLSSSHDLVTDGIAQVQRLLDKGVAPQNITLHGFSLGAAIASLVAQHFHQLGHPINIFNDRSFSTVTDFLVGSLQRMNPDTSVITMKLAEYLLKFLLALFKWEIDAASAFKSIPEAHRDYIVVRSKKADRAGRLDDNCISHYASIHKALTAERRAKKSKIDEEIAKIDIDIQTTSPQINSEWRFKKADLQAQRQHIKSERKMQTVDPRKDGHSVPLSKLTNDSGKTAQIFFQEFVQKTQENFAAQRQL